MNLTPSYMKLSDTGELQSRAERMAHMLKKCALCPRACAVDRTSDELGECKAGAGIMVSNAFLHFGEEPPLVGMGGSGTIFLTHCNLRCVFCQNFHISHIGHGEEVGADELARMTLQLQAMGAQNINFVTPTHYAPQIVEAVAIAAERGLQLPIVWNCGGYESLPVIRALEGIVDIYMPDIKFFDNDSSTRYMDAPNYPKVARSAGVMVSLIGADMNLKEKLFCVIAYTPKATVQAAIGAVPLEAGIAGGEVILAVAALSIIITAPLGAIGIRLAGEKWLEVEKRD